MSGQGHSTTALFVSFLQLPRKLQSLLAPTNLTRSWHLLKPSPCPSEDLARLAWHFLSFIHPALFLSIAVSFYISFYVCLLTCLFPCVSFWMSLCIYFVLSRGLRGDARCGSCASLSLPCRRWLYGPKPCAQNQAKPTKIDHIISNCRVIRGASATPRPMGPPSARQAGPGATPAGPAVRERGCMGACTSIQREICVSTQRVNSARHLQEKILDVNFAVAEISSVGASR